jgi:hypothetical protein
MTVKIPLRLAGVDLRDTAAYECVPDGLAELSFEAVGGVSLAVVYASESDPVAEAATWAHLIAELMPGVTVAEAYDELVSVSDISARCGVAAEAARLWAAGKRRASLRQFPGPRQVVGAGSGGKTMSLYAWRDVLAWAREVIGIDPDEGIDYLGDRQYVRLNAEIVNLTSAGADTWQGWDRLGQATQRVTASMGAATGAVSQAGGMIERINVVLDGDDMVSGVRASRSTFR